MTYHLRPMTADDGEAVAHWRYPGPWAVYDATGPLDPAEGYWSVVDEFEAFVGFACFGVEARVPGLDERDGVLDVGVGMRPELTGRGRGGPFAEAVLRHAREVAGARRVRAVVQQWNERSLRLLRGLGFAETGRHDVPSQGQRYVVLERDL